MVFGITNSLEALRTNEQSANMQTINSFSLFYMCIAKNKENIEAI